MPWHPRAPQVHKPRRPRLAGYGARRMPAPAQLTDAYARRLEDLLAELAAGTGSRGPCAECCPATRRRSPRGAWPTSATGVEVTPDTLFQLGSISKLYTATLVLQAQAAGLVSLDEPVRAQLQEFSVADPGATIEITPATPGHPHERHRGRPPDRHGLERRRPAALRGHPRRPGPDPSHRRDVQLLQHGLRRGRSPARGGHRRPLRSGPPAPAGATARLPRDAHAAPAPADAPGGGRPRPHAGRRRQPASSAGR